MITLVLPFGLLVFSAATYILIHKRFRKGYGISILIPFRCLDKNNQRWENAQWLEKFWKKSLPGAQIVIGDDPSVDLPFSKSVAINQAAKKAKGDVFVVIDADGYMPPASILHCAKEIRTAKKKGYRLWFVPYRLFYRLNKEASRRLLESSPKKAVTFSCPPNPKDILGDTDPSTGHWYGAMIQIMPREAFEIVGGWDERFRGWGGEDHAAMRAMDTLYCLHKTLPGQVLHVWHPQIGKTGEKDVVSWKERMWENQTDPGANNRLSWRYYHSIGKPLLMRQLINEGLRREGQQYEGKQNWISVFHIKVPTSV